MGAIDDLLREKQAIRVSETETDEEPYPEFGQADITFYVAEDGNDANDGLTPETAFKTRRRAFDAITDGEIPIGIPVTLNEHGEYEPLADVLRRQAQEGAG